MFLKISISNITFCLTILFFIAVVKLVHLFPIQRAKMSPLTDFCSSLLRLNGNFPWRPSKITLAIMHHGIVVIWGSQTVDTVAIFVKVVCLA